MQPCLPVSRRRKRSSHDPSSAVDFKDIESMDAMEYLASVVQEAKSIPTIMTVDPRTEEASNAKQMEEISNFVPIEGSAASLHYLLSGRTAVLPPPTPAEAPPSQTWVDGTLANFSTLREHLEDCQENGIGSKSCGRRQPVPPMKDRYAWHVFCVGRAEADGNAGSYFEDDAIDDEEHHSMQTEGDTDISKVTEPAWKKDLPLIGFEPTVALVCQMDQVMVRRVLAHLTHYVAHGWSTLTKQRTVWVYALLARLEKPLHRDDAALLYTLLKELTLIRAEKLPCPKNERVESLARLNTLISIVGLYFEQGGGYANVMEPKQNK